MQKLVICLLFCGVLLFAGCASVPPSIIPIEKNTSPDDGNYAEYGMNVAEVPSQNAAPKTTNPLPKLPDVPKVLQPKNGSNSSLKLVEIRQKAEHEGIAPVGAVAKAWFGGYEEGANYYYLVPGGTAMLSDGTKLELASFNSDWSQGGIWATFVIGGTRRTVNVGQEADAGGWTVRTMDLFLQPEKVYAKFLLSDFDAQKELNVSLGTKIYTSGQKVYEAVGIYSGYSGNYSGVVLSEGQRRYSFETGEEKPLPLE